MSKSLAVFRIEPVHESDLAAMAAHHDRRAEQDVHVDTSRTGLNVQLIGTGDTKSDALKVIGSAKAAKSGGPVAADGILAAGRDYFDEHYPNWRDDSSVLQPWIDANLDFLRSGKVGTVTSAVLHLDEEVPHIHFVSIPISDVRLKNRFGERVERKISYGAIFSDSKRHIAECRKAGTTSTDTRLGRLQTDYARAVASVGLRRGITSKSKHESPADYRKRRARLEAEAAAAVPPMQPITKSVLDQPVLSLADKLDVLASGSGAKVIHQQQEKLVAVATEAVQRGKTVKASAALSIENTELKIKVETLQKSLQEKDTVMQQQADSLKRNGDRMKAIRELAPDRLGQLMGYTQEQMDPIIASGKKWNAINVVMALDNLDFISATQALLAVTGNAEAVADAAAEHTRDEVVTDAPKLLTAKVPKKSSIHKRQEAEVTRELEAIAAARYRITLMHNDKTKPTINLGKAKVNGDAERFYTAQEVLDLLPTLGYRNAGGYNIFVTPIPDETHFILVDDIRDLEKVREYEPALILQSSPKSSQALLKVNGNYNSEQLNAYFRNLNSELGDPKITGVVHPLRLAGFTNRKPKHKDSRGHFPFVSILESGGGFSRKAKDDLEQDFKIEVFQSISKARSSAIPEQKRPRVQIDAWLMKYAQQFYAIAANRGEQDTSRTDFALAKTLQATGWGDGEIAAVIQAYSPDIESRHRGHVDGYIRRTITAAAEKPDFKHLKLK
jgi:hypothetical protein